MAEEENFDDVVRATDREDFDVVMRGYDRNQVDKTIEEMRLEIEHQATYNEQAASEITILKAEGRAPDQANAEAWTGVARVLLNTDEFINRN